MEGNVIVSNCSFEHNQGLSLTADVYVFGGNERLTNLFVRSSNFINNQNSASIGVRSLRCFGVINSLFANSSWQGVHALDVGGQCESVFSDEDVLFNRSSISLDSKSVASVSDFLGMMSVTASVLISGTAHLTTSHCKPEEFRQGSTLALF